MKDEYSVAARDAFKEVKTKTQKHKGGDIPYLLIANVEFTLGFFMFLYERL